MASGRGDEQDGPLAHRWAFVTSEAVRRAASVHDNDAAISVARAALSPAPSYVACSSAPASASESRPWNSQPASPPASNSAYAGVAAATTGSPSESARINAPEVPPSPRATTDA